MGMDPSKSQNAQMNRKIFGLRMIFHIVMERVTTYKASVYQVSVGGSRLIERKVLDVKKETNTRVLLSVGRRMYTYSWSFTGNRYLVAKSVVERKVREMSNDFWIAVLLGGQATYMITHGLYLLGFCPDE